MDCNQKVQKRDRWIDGIFFGILFVLSSCAMFYLFYKQTLNCYYPVVYESDMKAYIQEMQGLESGYSFPYPIFFKIAALFHLLFNPELSVALATLALNCASILIMKVALNYIALSDLRQSMKKCKWMAGVAISVMAVGLFFVSMLFPPVGIYLPGIKFRYMGVFTANPFHNATFMAARPFAILAFLWYAKLMPVYEKGYSGKWKQGQEGVDMRDYLLFSVFLLLATMTKPSFTLVLVGTAGLIMLFRMFRSKFRNFVPTVQLGVCFLPTFADLLYQYKGVFVPEEGEEGGIGFCLGDVWSLYCDNIPLAIGLAIGFPVLVLVLNYKELKSNSLFRFSWQIYVVSLAMVFLIYEKGFRATHFNFSWGYMYGIFFAFVGAAVVLLKATATKKKPLLLGIQWLAFFWHLSCGLYYFGEMSQGITYY